jgi:transcriptional regulator with XRE-family HTH domain
MANGTTEFIGDRVRQLREKRGLSAAEIQRITNGQLSERTLWRLEKAGVCTPRTARLLALAFECSVEEVWGGHPGILASTTSSTRREGGGRR